MLFAVIILIYVKSYPLLQVILLLFMQLANEVVLLLLRPLESPKDNLQDFTTELLTTIYLIFYLLLTDVTATEHNGLLYDGVPLKIFSSWCLVVLLFLALLISFSTILLDVYRTLRMSYLKFRKWRAKKYLMSADKVKKEPINFPFYQGDGDLRPVHHHMHGPLGLIPEDEDEDDSDDDGYEK
jgi:hypothetical protein